jgi:membrane protease YdiL (CAAX protease family)
VSTTRGLRAPTIARAAAPVLLLLAAMAIPAFAAVATVVLAIGAVIAVRRDAPVAWAWAAMVPATALATVRWFSGVLPADLAATCDPAGPPRIAWAVVEAIVVLGTFTALAVLVRTRRASVGLRRPARRAVRDAILGFGAFAIGGLVIVSILRGGLPVPAGGGSSTATFIVSVLLGAASIALAEELAFRGVVQHWLARTTGEWPAVVVQGVAYGLWVAAVGWGPLVGILAVGSGVVAGVITMRTNSILTVLAWHAGIAVPLLAVMVCR